MKTYIELVFSLFSTIFSTSVDNFRGIWNFMVENGIPLGRMKWNTGIAWNTVTVETKEYSRGSARADQIGSCTLYSREKPLTCWYGRTTILKLD